MCTGAPVAVDCWPMRSGVAARALTKRSTPSLKQLLSIMNVLGNLELPNATAFRQPLWCQTVGATLKRGIASSERQDAWLRKAHGSCFPIRGVLRLGIGVCRLRNLERPC